MVANASADVHADVDRFATLRIADTFAFANAIRG